MMQIITKTLLKRLAFTTFLATAILLAGVWLTQSLRFIQIIVNHNVSISDYFTLISFLLPDLLAQILPICIFVSILFIYSRMDSDHELIAFRAAGQSNWQLAKPAIILAIIAMLGVALVHNYIAPASYRLFRDHEYQIRNELASIFIQEGTFTTLHGITVYVKNRDLNGTLHNIFIYKRDPKNSYTITAQRGKIENNEAGPRLLLFDGVRQEVDLKTHQNTRFRFEELSYDLTPLVQNAKPRTIRPYEQSVWELLYPSQEESDPILSAKIRAEAHQRILMPFFVLILTFISLNTVLRRPMTRNHRLVYIFTGVFMATCVYISILGLINLHKHFMNAIPLAYGTVFLWLSLGMYLLKPGRWMRP